MEQNREPRNKLRHTLSINVSKKPRIYNAERTVSSINGIGSTDSHVQKNETRPPSSTIHKNKLKID